MKPPRSFKPLAEHLGDAIVITDNDGRIDWVNPAFTKMCGYTLRELKGHKPGEMLQGPDSSPQAAKKLNNAFRRGHKTSVEMINYHKNKRPYAVWISMSPIKNSAGQLTGFIAVERETTDLQCEFRKLEEQIAQLYQIICKLTSTG